MDEIKQKKKMLLEVLLVTAFFILIICGLIYTFQKIKESQPVQSTITFVNDERALLQQNIHDTKSWFKNLRNSTQLKISEALPWLHLDVKPVEALENNPSDAATNSEAASPATDMSVPSSTDTQTNPTSDQETKTQPQSKN